MPPNSLIPYLSPQELGFCRGYHQNVASIELML